jgi:hypothetical protein
MSAKIIKFERPRVRRSPTPKKPQTAKSLPPGKRAELDARIAEVADRFSDNNKWLVTDMIRKMIRNKFNVSRYYQMPESALDAYIDSIYDLEYEAFRLLRFKMRAFSWGIESLEKIFLESDWNLHELVERMAK